MPTACGVEQGVEQRSQSETASEPSIMDSVSRFGLATEPGIQMPVGQSP